MVDVTVTMQIDAPPAKIAAVMFDAQRDAEWIGGARKAEKLTPGPYGLGTKVKRDGAFLGRTFSWTTEVAEFDPDRLVRMKHVAGPFKGGVDYSIMPSGSGAEVSIRNYGEASFRFPFMAAMMRMSVGRDLQRLKKLVEQSA
jgi:carbon monoxide dehydrogenase subunit G